MSSTIDILSAGGKPSPGQAAGTSEVLARVPEFAELTSAATPTGGTIKQLLDVTVTINAELGRVTLPIGDILKLGIGSVLELNRNISEPVELVVQGVPLARGEVVVVDDRFAIRIQEIVEPKKRD